MALHEPPHAHIVCRGCGRISPVELLPEEGQQLIALADRSPEGWTVGGIAFSLTGLCAACREGRRA
jgi:Fe2+ or Zn2+ uptake regulation protein